ncbi:uncharacterized protein LOC141665049 [Apium graveolens]|uniref:uncharacterized protein LOC141665049 n=1 Tax=Apium graveolens TaxID=4045 RepID=UPI003D78F864
MYHNIRDALKQGDTNPENVGKSTILPASFTGSKWYMNHYFKDDLAICRTLGHPSLFLTMTTNTKWPEIRRMLKFLPGIDVVDAPDVVVRVFKMKVDQLLDQIINKNCFGRFIGGHDTATMCLRKKTNNKNGCTTPITPEKRLLDEVKQYLDGRYAYASEASCIHSRWPPVERLPINLPNDKHVSFKDSQNLQEVYDNLETKESKLEA